MEWGGRWCGEEAGGMGRDHVKWGGIMWSGGGIMWSGGGIMWTSGEGGGGWSRVGVNGDHVEWGGSRVELVSVDVKCDKGPVLQ